MGRALVRDGRGHERRRPHIGSGAVDHAEPVAASPRSTAAGRAGATSSPRGSLRGGNGMALTLVVPASTVVALAIAGSVALRRRRRLGQQRRAAESAALQGALEVLVGELRVGVHPVAAFRRRRQGGRRNGGDIAASGRRTGADGRRRGRRPSQCRGAVHRARALGAARGVLAARPRHTAWPLVSDADRVARHR